MLFGKKRKLFKKFAEANNLMAQWGTINLHSHAMLMLKAGKLNEAKRMLKKSQEEFDRAMMMVNVNNADKEIIRQNLEKWTNKLYDKRGKK